MSPENMIMYPDHRINNPVSGDMVIETGASELATGVTKRFAVEIKLCAVGLDFESGRLVMRYFLVSSCNCATKICHFWHAILVQEALKEMISEILLMSRGFPPGLN